MAVSTKKARSKDKSNGRCVDVHYVAVTKSNRKGAAECFGGTFIAASDHPNNWYIELWSTVGIRSRRFDVIQGDIVFRTGKNKRWQVLPRPHFKKRFPEIKL